MVLLPTRIDGRPSEIQDRIVADQSQATHDSLDCLLLMFVFVCKDTWMWGVVLFEMCSGYDLFAKDMSDDTIVSEADRRTLKNWQACQWSNKIFIVI